MKIRYIGTSSVEYLTYEKEYYCCKVRTSMSVDQKKFWVTYVVFDNDGFLMPIESRDCVVCDNRIFDNWDYVAEENDSGVSIDYKDQRLDEVGDPDIVIDLPSHILDQAETGDYFFDTDGMQKRLNKLRKKIEDEHNK